MIENRAGGSDAYYVDFTVSGGVVYSQPPRSPVESQGVSGAVGHTEGFDNHKKQIIEMISPASTLEGGAKKTLMAAKGIFRGLLNLDNSFADIGEGYYLGRFSVARPETTDESHATQPIGLSYKGDNALVYQIFHLSPEAFMRLSGVVGLGPMDYNEYLKLRTQSGDETTSSYYKQLQGMALSDRLSFMRSQLDEFWNQMQVFSQGSNNGQSDEKMEFLRQNQLKLAAIRTISADDKKRLINVVSKWMLDAGITALSTGEGAMIGYMVDGTHIRYRSLPVPSDKIRLFQRHFLLGEEPLNKDQVAGLYKKFVDSKAAKFGKRDISRSLVQETSARERGDFISALYMQFSREKKTPPEIVVRSIGVGTSGFEAVCEIVGKDGKKVRLHGYSGDKKSARQQLAEKILNFLSKDTRQGTNRR